MHADLGAAMGYLVVVRVAEEQALDNVRMIGHLPARPHSAVKAEEAKGAHCVRLAISCRVLP